MAGRVVLEAAPDSLLSTIASKLKKLVGTADEAAKLARSAEASLLVSNAEVRLIIRDWLHALQEATYKLDESNLYMFYIKVVQF
jgi:hypothetical protein